MIDLSRAIALACDHCGHPMQIVKAGDISPGILACHHEGCGQRWLVWKDRTMDCTIYPNVGPECKQGDNGYTDYAAAMHKHFVYRVYGLLACGVIDGSEAADLNDRMDIKYYGDLMKHSKKLRRRIAMWPAVLFNVAYWVFGLLSFGLVGLWLIVISRQLLGG